MHLKNIGAMDPSAYMNVESWEKVLKESNLNAFDLRDNRYNQVNFNFMYL